MDFKLFLLFVLFSSVYADCPNGTISTFSDQTWCYSFQNNQTNFVEAEKVCVQLGGHLASIHNMFEDNFLAGQAALNFFDDQNGEFWIGLNDINSTGKWSWTDGTSLDFQDWEQGEPSNLNKNKCGAAWRGYGIWQSMDCASIRPFVCLLSVTDSSTTASSVETIK